MSEKYGSNVLGEAGGAGKTPGDRRMVKATLLGKHSHPTECACVHIWTRKDKYLARFRFENRLHAVTLGTGPDKSGQELHNLLSNLQQGLVVRPDDRKGQIRRTRGVPLTLRALAADFLADKRSRRGESTANAYKSRLAPALDFAEGHNAVRRWPFAHLIDEAFVRGLREYLYARRTTRNGRYGGLQKPLSQRQIVNVMQTLRMLLNWGKSAKNRKLPADWVSPLTGCRPCACC